MQEKSQYLADNEKESDIQEFLNKSHHNEYKQISTSEIGGNGKKQQYFNLLLGNRNLNTLEPNVVVVEEPTDINLLKNSSSTDKSNCASKKKSTSSGSSSSGKKLKPPSFFDEQMSLGQVSSIDSINHLNHSRSRSKQSKSSGHKKIIFTFQSSNKQQTNQSDSFYCEPSELRNSQRSSIYSFNSNRNSFIYSAGPRIESKILNPFSKESVMMASPTSESIPFSSRTPLFYYNDPNNHKNFIGESNNRMRTNLSVYSFDKGLSNSSSFTNKKTHNSL